MATTLSEAYRDYPLHLHHIIPLDFSSIKTLPDSHAWPQSEDYDNDGPESCIPIIDLMDPNAMKLIGLACEKWGAFQLNNHGINLSVIEEVEEEAKRLFALPADRKLKALRSAAGATGYGRARISPFFPKHMWHEGFTIMGSPCDDAKKIWPNDYARFCGIMENYQKQMKALAEKLTHMIFNSLEISEEQKRWVGSTNLCEAVQLNFYPCCPEPDRAMGLAPHTDTSFLTILHQSQTNGLQIFKEGAGWVPVHPHPNTLVVNTGDILHILSNSRFRCALHRVTVNSTKHRYSMAYFYSPPLDYVVSPLVVNSIPHFRTLTVKEYIGIKAKNLGGALSLISMLKS
ncbi:gibberellin 3-beta-dioxygenase 1-like [Abrus precatorius]|uniref:gibberellin 3beta-dioxygenase n=1 Tax=Abrus precatorius TaxID=3816 RepID=A0A8B8JQS6_ABRPR|nr:gibberellin 3-beta-dioxygenase 1-like [Abrus precatorius]